MCKKFHSAVQTQDGAEQKVTGPVTDAIQNAHSELQEDEKVTENAAGKAKNISGDSTIVGRDATVHNTQASDQLTAPPSSATPGGDAEDMEEISPPDFSDNAKLPQGSDKTTEAIDSALKDLPPKYVILLCCVTVSDIVLLSDMKHSHIADVVIKLV